MQIHASQIVSLSDIPMGFFPDEVSNATAVSRSAADPASFADSLLAKAEGSLPSRALKIARAKTGETELRLLAEQASAGIRFVLVSSTIAPYATKRELLVKPGKKKAPMNEQQAIEEFERRVALAYPPEKLRNNKFVAIHLNLI
jgi:hypothetical protein